MVFFESWGRMFDGRGQGSSRGRIPSKSNPMEFSKSVIQALPFIWCFKESSTSYDDIFWKLMSHVRLKGSSRGRIPSKRIQWNSPKASCKHSHLYDVSNWTQHHIMIYDENWNRMFQLKGFQERRVRERHLPVTVSHSRTTLTQKTISTAPERQNWEEHDGDNGGWKFVNDFHDWFFDGF